MTRQVIDEDARLAWLFDSLPYPAAVVAQDGTLRAANAALSDFLGYSPTEMVGMHFSRITAGGDVARDVEQFERLVSGDINHYTLHKWYLPNMAPPRPGRLSVKRTPWGSGELLMLGFILPLDAFEAAGVTPDERKATLQQAVGELILATWRIWVPILAILLGISNVDKIIAALNAGG